MQDGNAKHDLEHTAERTVAVSGKGGKTLTKFFSKLFVKITRWYHKHFSSSMKALKKDGSTKELFVSPPLTKSEAKQIIASAKENDILIGVKKMQPDGEFGKNKSLHSQEKMARNEIKYRKWREKVNTPSKIKLLNHFYKSKADKYRKLSLQDEQNKEDEKYVVIVNKSRVGFLNEELAKIPQERVKRMASNELNEMDKDSVDERDIEPMLSRGMNLKVEELSKVGEDFGSCLVRDYQKNYCIQKITKEEYCEIREQLFNLPSHGAKVLNDKEMMIAIRSEDLEEYRAFAPSDRPIKEYGAFGGRNIETESNSNDIIELELENNKDYEIFRNQYDGKDFFIQHNPNSTKKTVLVREVDTKDLVEEVKKKSTTADLVKEANEYADKNQNTPEIENPILEHEEESEIAR